MDSSEHFDHYLKLFYKKIFPCELLCRWLTYSSRTPSEMLSRREFSFTLPGDIYIRYQSFNDPASLRKELVKSCPYKIDIGAVYSAPPKLQRSLSNLSFTPEWKELVFDIDLTDYDEIRFCCGAVSSYSKGPVCHKCWELAKCAVICMDRALREDFGFEHILWVYSGRRGVHCWVSDRVARHLDSAGRTAIAEYLSIAHCNDGKKQSKLKTGLVCERSLHPSLEAASNFLNTRFVKYCASQEFLGSRHPERLGWLLNYLPSDLSSHRSTLLERWTSVKPENEGDDSLVAKRWNTLKCFLQNEKRDNVVKDIVLSTLYPRLDVNVTTGPGHLLKSPFCVHPKTGYVCVPIDPQTIDEFDPLSVPKLSELSAQLSQLNPASQDESGPRHFLAYKQTSLRRYIDFFEGFVNRLNSSEGVEPVNNAAPEVLRENIQHRDTVACL